MAGIFLAVAPGIAQRSYGGYYTKERLENLRANADTVDWVQKLRTDAVAAAKPWLERSDEELWRAVPGQSLPRTIDVTWDYNFPKNPHLGCLNCGDAITKFGNYPYSPDFDNKTFKLTCPNCKVVFPTNDFAAYYESGIDERGLFDPENADKKLLFNTEHPDPADPLHKYGVDDGYGFVTRGDDGTGKRVDRRYKFVAYYAWGYWRHLLDGLQKLSNAYIYTGDKAYARKAAILLDRIADVYPAMDWKPYADLGWYHSDGSSRRGKIEGRIWETQTVQHLTRSYDKIIHGTVDNPELYAFLGSMAKKYKLPGRKGTRADLIANIDAGIVKTAADALISGQIRGNEGMHQYSMASCAVALDTEPLTSQWLDWIFAEDGGHLPTTLMQLFDRDGMADEGAPGYCFLWPLKIVNVMDLLEPYTKYDRNRVSRDYPHFLNALLAPWRHTLLNSFVPNIGDSGATGTTSTQASASLMAAGFQYYGSDRAARYAWEAMGNRADRLLLDATSTNPAILNERLARAAAAYPPEQRLGANRAGFGFASFEFGGKNPPGHPRPDGKALWIYYGRNYHHGHLDRLNYGLYAFHTDLMPDLGYPEFANAIQAEGKGWTRNTISHNTVVVDKKPQAQSWTGYPQFYTVHDGFGAVEIESKNAYPQCSDYTRTLAFVRAPESEDCYALDIFRVAGGRDHLLSLHGPPGAVTAEGLAGLEKQTSGTYAGADVEFGTIRKGVPLGYAFLKNVERQTSPGAFILDWKAEAGYRGLSPDADIHLRAHIFGDALSDVALADGIPPQNKPGNPEKIRYALLHRAANDTTSPLASRFVSVLEPYQGSPFIKRTQQLAVRDGDSSGAVAVRVDLRDGTADYIISNPARAEVRTEGGPATDGAFAWVRVRDGQVTSASLTRGSRLQFEDFELVGAGDTRGVVLAFEKDPKKPSVLKLRLEEGSAGGITGSQIIVKNDRNRNACYDIYLSDKGTNDVETWDITCGPGSFVRGFVDDKDYSRGYTYNIEVGQEAFVPVTTTYGF